MGTEIINHENEKISSSIKRRIDAFTCWFEDNFSDQEWLDSEDTTDGPDGTWKSYTELPEYIDLIDLIDLIDSLIH